MSTTEQRTAQAVLEGLRSPLNGVAGLLDLLATTRLSVQQRQYLQVMQAAVTQLGIAVEDGLELSILDPALRVQSFSPTAILGSVRDAFLAPAHSRSIQLSLDASDTVPERLRGDAVGWRQLAFAAVERAFARAQTGIYGHLVYAEGALTLRVATDGPESPDFVPLVGDPPALVDALGGSWAASATGTGLTILLSLPASVDNAATPDSSNVVSIRSTIARHRISAPPSRILVVEDIRSTRTMIRAILERAGHTVVDCETAETALDILAQSSFDCAIVDLHLPDMHGAQFVRQWRFMEHGRRTPAIAISADTSDEALRQVETAGILGLIPKPPSPERLLAATSFALSIGKSDPKADDTPDEGAIIDVASFAETRALLGRKTMRTLVAQSIRDGRQCVTNITDAAFSHDVTRWTEAMQALHGVALTIGASKLAIAVSGAIERQDMFVQTAQPQFLGRLLAEAEHALAHEST